MLKLSFNHYLSVPHQQEQTCDDQGGLLGRVADNLSDVRQSSISAFRSAAVDITE
jgi:hypothetical protein